MHLFKQLAVASISSDASVLVDTSRIKTDLERRMSATSPGPRSPPCDDWLELVGYSSHVCCQKQVSLSLTGMPDERVDKTVLFRAIILLHFASSDV